VGDYARRRPLPVETHLSIVLGILSLAEMCNAQYTRPSASVRVFSESEGMVIWGKQL
jgi:hypothetical protein